VWKWSGLILACVLAAGCSSGPGTNPGVPEDGFQTITDREQSSYYQALTASGNSILLNPADWDYGPWVEDFQNALHRHWVVPYEYRLGVISGETVVTFVVEKNGDIRIIEVVESSGPSSLHEASVLAVESVSGLSGLPHDFPGKKLIVTREMSYPAWR